ncbi:MAG TPA: hypothetical protein VFH69_09410 [Gemmatimonadota bacterium]|nr:hypothetical protein [Gemmatimonadota bacterium]
MRPTIVGFLTATLYTLAAAALIAQSMPTQAQFRARIEAFRTTAGSTSSGVTDPTD